MFAVLKQTGALTQCADGKTSAMTESAVAACKSGKS